MDLALLAVFLILAYVFFARRLYMSTVRDTLDSRDTGAGNQFPSNTGTSHLGAKSPTGSVDGDSQHLIDARIKRMPDPRPMECRSRGGDGKATVSVVTRFFDYEFYDLKMTLSSVLMNTNPALLKEIIVVDDGSTLEYIIDAAQKYLQGIKKARVVRVDARAGPAGARLRGFEDVRGEIVVFIDTNTLVARGWLNPLVEHIQKNPKSIAVPHFDGIANPVDYEYNPTSDTLVASLTWALTVRMSESRDAKAEVTEPIRSPMLRGNVFAVSRSYFQDLGGYDPALPDGGGENLELSLRTWMCGGKIQVIPCSRVGILNLHDPVKIVSHINFRRVAELWLGQAKALAYRNAGVPADLPPQEQKAVEERRTALSHTNCHNIEWFFKNVAGNLPTPSEKARFFGLLKIRTGRCSRVAADGRLELISCSKDQYSIPPSEMFFEYDDDKYLTSNGQCLTVKPTAYVVAEACRPGDSQQRWEYKNNRFVNDWCHYCLMHVTDPDKQTGGKRQIAMAQECASAAEPAFIEFDFITL